MNTNTSKYYLAGANNSCQHSTIVVNPGAALTFNHEK